MSQDARDRVIHFLLTKLEVSERHIGRLLMQQDDSAEVQRLRDAILWALGENGEFDGGLAGKKPYWWRTELRKRAGQFKGSS